MSAEHFVGPSFEEIRWEVDTTLGVTTPYYCLGTSQEEAAEASGPLVGPIRRESQCLAGGMCLGTNALKPSWIRCLLSMDSSDEQPLFA